MEKFLCVDQWNKLVIGEAVLELQEEATITLDKQCNCSIKSGEPYKHLKKIFLVVSLFTRKLVKVFWS